MIYFYYSTNTLLTITMFSVHMMNPFSKPNGIDLPLQNKNIQQATYQNFYVIT